MEATTTTNYTTRNGSTGRVYRYADGSLMVCLTRDNLDATIFNWPGQHASGVVQDMSLDECTEAAYTGYEHEDITRLVLAFSAKQPLVGTDAVMMDCFCVYMSDEFNKLKSAA